MTSYLLESQPVLDNLIIRKRLPQKFGTEIWSADISETGMAGLTPSAHIQSAVVLIKTFV
jgi:hypothetical protein